MNHGVPYYGEALDYPEHEHNARLLMGDPKASAWGWICRYAESISRTEADMDEYHEYPAIVEPHELFDAARANIQSDSEYGDNYVSKGDLLEGADIPELFWDKMGVLLDTPIPEEKRQYFFSCSC